MSIGSEIRPPFISVSRPPLGKRLSPVALKVFQRTVIHHQKMSHHTIIIPLGIDIRPVQGTKGDDVSFRW
jgi:hypothetical protein